MSSPRRVLVGRPTAASRSQPPTSGLKSVAPSVPPTQQHFLPDGPSTLEGRRPPADLERAERLAAARGYADGHARGRAEVAEALAAAAGLAAELERLAPRDAARAAAAIARLALVVAERILGRAITLDPTLLVEVVERAAATVNGSPTARVILSPTARPLVEAAWIARYGTAYLGKRWSFEADPSLPPAGCRLVYEHGFVDASLDVQIEEIGRAIEHALPTLVRELEDLGLGQQGSRDPDGGTAATGRDAGWERPGLDEGAGSDGAPEGPSGSGR